MPGHWFSTFEPKIYTKPWELQLSIAVISETAGKNFRNRLKLSPPITQDAGVIGDTSGIRLDRRTMQHAIFGRKEQFGRPA
jgi:hypothetical protein